MKSPIGWISGTIGFFFSSWTAVETHDNFVPEVKAVWSSSSHWTNVFFFRVERKKSLHNEYLQFSQIIHAGLRSQWNYFDQFHTNTHSSEIKTRIGMPFLMLQHHAKNATPETNIDDASIQHTKYTYHLACVHCVNVIRNALVHSLVRTVYKHNKMYINCVSLL